MTRNSDRSLSSFPSSSFHLFLPKSLISTIVVLVALAFLPRVSSAAEIALRTRPHDPYGSPRPAPNQEHVPATTTFLAEFEVVGGKPGDLVLADSVSLAVEPEGKPAVAILSPGGKTAEGYRVRLTPGKSEKAGNSLIVYIDTERKLLPATRYTLRLAARSRDGAALSPQRGTWQFTTEASPAGKPVAFDLSLGGPAVRWQGGFFTGFCSTGFCTSAANRIPTYECMKPVRATSPRAWSLQRDFWLTGMQHQPAFLAGNLPNIVRELQTRRIAAIENHADGSLLRVEDFFGHQQYGIASNRPLSGDYHPGDEVLVADGVHDARSKVLRVDDAAHTVLVGPIKTPPGGWKIAYSAPLPTREDPKAPGLFPEGGCYLRKFRPAGTPMYYWGRLDSEWDIDHRRYGRRLMPNFTDAPGDLSIDGRNWTTAKDHAELHDATRAIAGHIIDRYGAASLEFPWSVFNEPDLGVLFWRSDWDELQKFYDYSVDAILRAFEDRGYDSTKVRIGGLELGGIFGVHLRLREFLVHCSPRARTPNAEKGVVDKNAAFADPRLAGKHSKRVETVCKTSGGRGSPCDFISIHAYNRSQLMADKLLRAKEMALEIDADYYAKLWINSHESCPGWDVPPDPAYADSYLGNGYYPTWCADVARRQLQRAADDPRYAFGESILTFWTWPCKDFRGQNDCIREIAVDDNGDGRPDRQLTVPMPILHFLGLVARMGPEYRVLPAQKIGGHTVSGFASRVDNGLAVLLYAHHMLDTESRSEAEFEVTVNIADLTSLVGTCTLGEGDSPLFAAKADSSASDTQRADKKATVPSAARAGKKATVPGAGPPVAVRIEEYRFDKDHNSYFRLGRQLRDRGVYSTVGADSRRRLAAALARLESKETVEQLAGLAELEALGPAAAESAGAVYQLHERSTDQKVRNRAMGLVFRLSASAAYPAAEVRKIQEEAALRATDSSVQSLPPDGRLVLKATVAANGANWIHIRPALERK